MTASRANQLRDSVAAAAGNPKKLWSATRRLLHSEPSTAVQEDNDCKKWHRRSQVSQDQEYLRFNPHISAIDLLVDAVFALINLRTFTESALSAFSAVTTNDVVTKLIYT